ncbi:hypothetical protein N665_0465s0009 [Sinapis alba]|nr:hypothetical protein N665_0465s0009 [Sinapis alba]
MKYEFPPQKWKLLYIGLYLLIWGEAANLRLMPECLCYIYHNMGIGLYNMLRNGDIPAHGSKNEAFLEKVVTPVYKTLAKEAKGGREGEHSKSTNYDDFNEYFWSVSTTREEQWHLDFFSQEIEQDKSEAEQPQQSPKRITIITGDGSVGKVNFIESRSFLHLLRSFDRMWMFYTLSLQVMIIIAWNQSTQLGDIFRGEGFHNVFRIFIITVAALEFVQAMLEIYLSFNARHSIPNTWAIYVTMSAVFFPITYFSDQLRQPYFIMGVYIYLLLKIPLVLLFFFPSLNYSDNVILKRVMPFYKPLLYIGRGMHENTSSYLKYIFFWILLFSLKFAFSYNFQIQPLVGPTKEIMRLHLSFSYAKYIGLLITLWSPVISIYFMDTQIWYAVVSTLVGGCIGILGRLGEVQTLGMLRTRFKSLSGDLNQRLVPVSEPQKIISTDEESKLDAKEEEHEEHDAKNEIDEVKETKQDAKNEVDEVKQKEQHANETRYRQMWNTIITSLREEDLINDGEKDLMLVPYWEILDAKENEDRTRWPLFLLTNKIHMVLDIAKYIERKESKQNDDAIKLNMEKSKQNGDAIKLNEEKSKQNGDAIKQNEAAVKLNEEKGKLDKEKIKLEGERSKLDDEKIKRTEALDADVYVRSAVLECYTSLKFLLRSLVKAGPDRNLIEHIFTKIGELSREQLTKDVNWSVLPALYDQFLQLVEYLQEDKVGPYNISRILRHMLQVVESSMMKDGFPSLKELIEDNCLCRFVLPLDPDIKDWKQNIRRLHLLLKHKDPAIDVPSNLEAQRRLTYFSSSFLMEMPNAPRIENMLSFSALTPYYSEDVIYSNYSLTEPNEDGISILSYLQTIFPDEWTNFLERFKRGIEKDPRERENLEETEKDLRGKAILEEIGKSPIGRAILEEIKKEPKIRERLEEELRLWASYRGQTLARTVRGMMYYRKAIEIQAFFDLTDTKGTFPDLAINEELLKGRNPCESTQTSSEEKLLLDECRALADMKFTYVVSCQRYGIFKRSGDQRAKDILKLMTMYPYLRVAYIDEVEQIRQDKVPVEKVYYSVLVKAAPPAQGKIALDELLHLELESFASHPHSQL